MINQWVRGAAVLLVSLSFGFGAAARAAVPSAAQVRELLQVIGIDQTMRQMNTQAALMMHKQIPCVPGSFWQQFANGPSAQQLIQRMIPIYQRHFTEQDIKGLIKFYATPLGRKVLIEMPQVMGEVAEVNQKWSRERMTELETTLKSQAKLNARGLCLSAASRPIVPDLGDEGAVINASRAPAARHTRTTRGRHGKAKARLRQHHPAASKGKPTKAKPKTKTKASKTTKKAPPKS